MNILYWKSMFTDEQYNNIEEYYKAKFICETCLKNIDGGWANIPVAVFYTENAHPEGSNWFGLYYNHDNKLMITDAKSALEPFDALLFENGDILYSRYRHDYRTYGNAMVDGGRDYFRYTPTNDSKMVKIQIMKDKLEIVDDDFENVSEGLVNEKS